MPDLAAWSVVFEKIPGLILRSAPSPCITYRLGKGERGEDTALRILLCYREAKNNETKGETASQ